MKLLPNTIRILCGIACSVILALSAQAAEPTQQPLLAVASIDVERYQGTWHQIALYPNKFQKSCVSNTRAQYALQPGGELQVINQCRGNDGKDMKVQGTARPADAASITQGQLSPPQLQVRFAPAWLAWLPVVWGDYWVIQLAPDYRYAVVGEPKREYLWVLGRDTQLSAADWASIQTRLKEQGYDPAKLVREKHLP